MGGGWASQRREQIYGPSLPKASEASGRRPDHSLDVGHWGWLDPPRQFAGTNHATSLAVDFWSQKIETYYFLKELDVRTFSQFLEGLENSN